MITKSQAKYIQSLSQKKFRDEENAFVAEGPKIINELLGCPNVELVALYALPAWVEANGPLISPIPSEKQIIIKEIDLERVSSLQTPNHVLGIFRKPRFKKPIFDKKISLLLDSIQDPGNLGTLIRTADWFGIESIMCSKECADVFNPKIVQSTMGSIARVQVLYGDLLSFIIENKKIPVFAAVLDGQNLYEIKAIQEGFILIGNESKGVGSDLLSLDPQKISIPKIGQAESLNAAVAGAIIMSHMTAGS